MLRGRGLAQRADTQRRVAVRRCGQDVDVPDERQQPSDLLRQIRVDPTNDQKLFQGGAQAQMSLDGGKTWRGLQGTGHGDYHAIWINPKDPRIVAVGHDGGLDISNDGGFSWDYHNDMALGQFYQVSADMRRPYYVCGGLQDNQAYCGPSAVRSSYGGVNTDWYNIGGGDGFYTRQDPTDWTIQYAESQNGNMQRHDLRTGTSKSIRPNAGGGGRGGGRGAPAAEGGARGGAAPPQPAAGGGAGGGGGGRGGSNILNAPPTSNPCGSTGTRRSRSRRTTRRSSTLRRSTSSSPPTAATRGR